VAFTYDNALASIALFACGKSMSHDASPMPRTRRDRRPEYHDGRIRNAYASGPVDGAPD